MSIQIAILKRDLKPPKNYHLKKEMLVLFQASRTTTREALRVMEFKGLIQVETGSCGGAYVISSPTK